MKTRKFEGKGPMKILRFLAQLKRVCDLSGVSQGIRLSIMPTFMKVGPVSSPVVWLNRYNYNNTSHRLPKAKEEQIFTYVKAVNFQLKSYATDSKIPKAILEIAAFKKIPIETSVQFADVLRTKVVCCGNAYLKERAKKVFSDGLPVNSQGAIRVSWRWKQAAHLLDIAQYEPSGGYSKRKLRARAEKQRLF